MAHQLLGRDVAPRGRSTLRHAGWIALGGLIGASLLGLNAAPVEAAHCGTVRIFGGTATPGSGTSATTFIFKVHYIDSSGAAPSSVRLGLGGTWTTMSTDGADYVAGVTFSGSRKVPVGTWTYFFRATFGADVACDNKLVTPTQVTVITPT